MNNLTLRHKLISVLSNINVIGVRAIVNYLPKIIIKKPIESLTINTIYGFKIEIDPVKDVGVERSLYYTGTYEEGTLSIIKSVLKEGDVFIDIGANIGFISIFASSLIGKTGNVYAFEPNPDTFTILKKNIELNQISNIETSTFAIGSISKTAKIYSRWNVGRGAATLYKPDYETESYDVNVVTLSDYFGESMNKVELVKLDIEGYELPALIGAKKIIVNNWPMLIVEYSVYLTDFEENEEIELFDFLMDLKKYKLFKLVGSKNRVSKLEEITSPKKMPMHDNVFCFTKEHISKIPKSIFKTSLTN